MCKSSRQLGLSENGSTDSRGPTGEPSPSGLDAPNDVPGPTPGTAAPVGVTMVRRHQGRSDISVASLILLEEHPAFFSAWKLGDLGGYTVTLSFDLTSQRYKTLIDRLGTRHSIAGESATVGVEFVPTTPNLVQPTIAAST